MKLYLVGFMGSGKTTVGRELAMRIDVPFFDLDDLIESSEKMSIREIFAQFGEPYFRKREREILRSTKHLEAAVIATGGGTFTFEDNIQFIQSVGMSIFFSAPYSLLRTRIDTKGDRPLFRDDLETHELFANRIRYYRMSDLTLEIREDETPGEIAERRLWELPQSVVDAARQAAGRAGRRRAREHTSTAA